MGTTSLADRVAAKLRRPSIRVSTRWWWRSASLRLENGREDVESRLTGWVDVAALQRELLDPLSPAGDGRYLTMLRDPQTDRSTRQAYRVAPPGAAVLLDGPLLGELVPRLDAVVHVQTSIGTLRRALPADRQWELAAFAEYEAHRAERPAADVVIAYNHPAAPAVWGLPSR